MRRAFTIQLDTPGIPLPPPTTPDLNTTEEREVMRQTMFAHLRRRVITDGELLYIGASSELYIASHWVADWLEECGNPDAVLLVRSVKDCPCDACQVTGQLRGRPHAPDDHTFHIFWDVGDVSGVLYSVGIVTVGDGPDSIVVRDWQWHEMPTDGRKARMKMRMIMDDVIFSSTMNNFTTDRFEKQLKVRIEDIFVVTKGKARDVTIHTEPFTTGSAAIGCSATFDGRRYHVSRTLPKHPFRS